MLCGADLPACICQLVGCRVVGQLVGCRVVG